MGLDGVELVMEVEERYGIKLPDAEISRIRTVADLAGLVVARLPHINSICPTASMFYAIRRIFTEHAGVQRETVRPSARLNDLFPSQRHRIWRELRRHEISLPQLELSERLDRLLLWSSAVGAFALVGIFAALWIATNGWFALVVCLALITLYVGALCLVNRRFAVNWPKGVSTVGDLVRAVSPYDASSGSPGQRLLTQVKVLEEVRQMTAEQRRISIEKVKPESDFVRDLNLD
jgi:acyl carrier protein